MSQKSHIYNYKLQRKLVNGKWQIILDSNIHVSKQSNISLSKETTLSYLNIQLQTTVLSIAKESSYESMWDTRKLNQYNKHNKYLSQFFSACNYRGNGENILKRTNWNINFVEENADMFVKITHRLW